MRREEIANLLWGDIRFSEGTIVVTKTKTGTPRTLPLHSTLKEYLQAVPDSKRVGYVIQIPDDSDRVARLNTL
ncbi:MAG: tyrosine-type recombinase/integrase, partial [Planctomycetes bacterium]|nr:tyrosine-type recombinase/integrase [Planctomycetota bacterium]